VKEEPSIVRYYLDHCNANIVTIPWVEIICQYGYADLSIIQYLIEEKKAQITLSQEHLLSWKGKQFSSALIYAMNGKNKNLTKYFFDLVNIDDDVSMILFFIIFLSLLLL